MSEWLHITDIPAKKRKLFEGPGKQGKGNILQVFNSLGFDCSVLSYKENYFYLKWYPNVLVNNSPSSNKYIIYTEVTRLNNKQEEPTIRSVIFLFLFSTLISLRQYQANAFGSPNSNLVSGLNQLFTTTEGTGVATSSSVYVACRPELEGLVLESKSFLHWSQWKCHHWLHGNNWPLWILDNFWVVWNSGGKGWYMLFQSGPRLNHQERHRPEKQKFAIIFHLSCH